MFQSENVFLVRTQDSVQNPYRIETEWMAQEPKKVGTARAVADEQRQSFGSELRSLRQAKGMGLRQFARALSVSPSHVCNLECGRDVQASEDLLCRMAEVLEIPPTQFLAKAGKLPPDTMLCLLGTPGYSTDLVHDARHESGRCPDVLSAGRGGAENLTGAASVMFLAVASPADRGGCVSGWRRLGVSAGRRPACSDAVWDGGPGWLVEKSK